jgi:hypothetical protein
MRVNQGTDDHIWHAAILRGVASVRLRIQPLAQISDSSRHLFIFKCILSRYLHYSWCSLYNLFIGFSGIASTHIEQRDRPSCARLPRYTGATDPGLRSRTLSSHEKELITMAKMAKRCCVWKPK